MKVIKPLLLLSLFATPAAADSFETEYALSLNNYYGYTDYSSPYNRFHKQNNLNSSLNAYGRLSYAFNDDYNASLIGYFMIDSAKKIENYNQGIWGEEVYGLLETPVGEFSAGQNYNVAYEFAVGAPNVGAWRVNNTDLVNFIANPNWYKKGSKMSYKTLNSTYINTDGASLKVSYITPEYKGMKLGATYVPETYSQSGLVAKSAGYKDNNAYILGAYGFWDISGYELETSLGFGKYHKNDTEYSAGFSVYHKGWTLGASYRQTEADNKTYAINKDNLFDAYREGRAYNVGLSYAFGPLTTGISYFDTKADKTSNHDKIISFANSFQYNKYTNISLIVAHSDSQGENKDIADNAKGYAFILGLELSL